MSVSHPECPRPQYERKERINLNGGWTFVFDFGRTEMDMACIRNIFNREPRA